MLGTVKSCLNFNRIVASYKQFYDEKHLNLYRTCLKICKKITLGKSNSRKIIILHTIIYS